MVVSQAIIVRLFSTFLLLCYTTSFSRPGNYTDHQALLSLKANIVTDPVRFTTSWNESTHFCEWFGITCGRKHLRVTKIDLQSSNLGGSLSASIGNLSFLRELMLYNNSFRGIIPEEIGRLSRLQVLNLTHNSFSGEIPKNISNCFNLVDLSLATNNLTGTIPLEFQSLFKLQYLAVFENNLVGKIPAYIGNFTSLLAISFKHNNFEGNIPDSLGQLQEIYFFSLGENNLSGTIPTSLFNISSMEFLEISFNRLQGYLPPSLGSALPMLLRFSISEIFLIGRLPISLPNATNLWDFDAVDNGFTGGVPASFSQLRQLDYLGLSDNPLGNGKSTDLDFIFSLLNTSATLRDLVLYNCKFGGVLPRYIGNFTRLRGLSIGGNFIHGEIPTEIQFLVNMEGIAIDGNQQSGTIPTSLGSLHLLTFLDFSENKLSGEIPSSLGDLVAHVGDFGLAKFLSTEVTLIASSSEQMSSSIGVKGTIGYAAPEYGMGSDLSTFGDMYSYGILLLEIFTSKSPTSDIFNNGLNLHNYVKMAIPERVIEIVDPKLFHKEANPTPKSLVLRGRVTECIVSILKIGIACSMELPRDRMNIGNAIKDLHSIKGSLVELGDIRTIP